MGVNSILAESHGELLNNEYITGITHHPVTITRVNPSHHVLHSLLSIDNLRRHRVLVRHLEFLAKSIDKRRLINNNNAASRAQIIN
jgi:hypothetical protein